MSLPKIDIPVYELTLPVSGLKVKYRPLRVKEEKIVLLATQSGEAKDIQVALEQILTNCIVEGVSNLKDLPIADVQRLIIAIRDKSLGGTQEVTYTCNNAVGDKACGHKWKANIDFSKLEVIKGDAKDTVKISKDVGIKLRPPTFAALERYEDTADYDYDIYADAVEYVFDKDQTYKLDEVTKKERDEFFDNMSQKNIEEINAYIASMPRYEVDISHTCEKCGFKHEIKVRDLQNFFQ